MRRGIYITALALLFCYPAAATIIVRGSKSTGGVELQDGATIFSSELNNDFDTVYNLVNGNLDHTNISNTAGILPSQLSAFAASNAQFVTISNPGITGSLSLPTTLDQEISKLRFKIMELGLGTSAQTQSGAVAASWTDGSCRGVNQVANGDFEGALAAGTVQVGATHTSTLVDGLSLGTGNLLIGMSAVSSNTAANTTISNINSATSITLNHPTTSTASHIAFTFSPTAPQSWTLVGFPTASNLILTGSSEGVGNAYQVIARASNADGITQILTNLKPSTRYLVISRVAVTTGTMHLTSTGALTGSFGNLSLTETAAQSVGNFLTLSGVISTDSTPTQIQLNWVADADATADNFTVDHVGVYECNTDPIPPAGVVTVRSSTTDTASLYSTGSESDSTLTATVSPPSPGYQIVVDAALQVAGGAGGNDNLVCRLKENGTAIESTTVSCTFSGCNTPVPFHITRGVTALLGSAATYTIGCRSVNGGWSQNPTGHFNEVDQSWLEVKLEPIR